MQTLKIRDVFRGSTAVTDMTPQAYMDSMKDRKRLFLVVTSSCSNEKRKGSYRAMLCYGGKNKLLNDNMHDVTDANMCSLAGVTEALKTISSPGFTLCIITAAGLGFSGNTKGKGAHRGMVKAAEELAASKNITVEEAVFRGRAESVRAAVDTAFPLSKPKKNDPREKAVNLTDYTKVVSDKVRHSTLAAVAANMAVLKFTAEAASRVTGLPLTEVREIYLTAGKQ